MIQHNAICSQCGNVDEIDKNAKSFQAVLKVYRLAEHSFNDTFGNNWSSTKTKALPPDQTDFINSTFCDKNCYMEYIKQHMKQNGIILLTSL